MRLLLGLTYVSFMIYLLSLSSFRDFLQKSNKISLSSLNLIEAEALSNSTFLPCRERDSMLLSTIYEINSIPGYEWTNQWNLDAPMDTWWGVDLNPEGCVTRLELSENNMGHFIPSQFAGLKDLEYLDISNNRFTGCFNSESDFWCNQLTFLDFSGNEQMLFTDLDQFCNPEWELFSCTNPSGTYYLAEFDSITIDKERFFGFLSPEYLFKCTGNTTHNDSLLTSDCGPDTLLRRYDLFDLDGLFRTSCNMEILLQKPELSLISGPADIDIDCSENFSTISRFYPHPDFTSYPVYIPRNNVEVLINESFKNISSSFTEGPLAYVNGKGEFIRTWQVIDSCFPEDTLTFDQTIRFCIPCGLRDSLALRNIYSNTQGENWNNPWQQEQPISSWDGLQFNNEGCVISLILNNRNLDGQLPSELGDLLDLKTMGIVQNPLLNGNLPSEIEHLIELETMDISFNALNGNLPSELGSLSSLVTAYLNDNEFSGPIPSEIGGLQNIQSLDFSFNSLEGEVPSELSQLSQIQNLDLEFNQLSNISSLVNRLGGINAVNVRENQFTFEDLRNINSLINNSNSVLYAPQDSFYVDTTIQAIAGNPLSIDLIIDETMETNIYEWFQDGILDTTITGTNQRDFSNLEEDDAGIYQITITNPNYPQLSLQSRSIELVIESLDCSHPDFAPLIAFYNATGGPNWKVRSGWEEGAEGTNCAPCSWYGIECANGRVIGIDLDGRDDMISNPQDGNNLEGNFPNEIVDLTELRWLSLHENNLIGELPDFLAELSKLEYLALFANRFTGKIPVAWRSFQSLTNLNLSNNFLSGSIPEQISEITTLNQLVLDANKLDGTVPASLQNLNKLRVLRLDNNKFSGSFPDLSMLPLENLRIEYNQFTAIPDLSEISSWSSANSAGFQVYENRLTFEHILPNMDVSGTWRYAPQDSVFVDTTIFIKEGNAWQIDLLFDKSIVENQYQWFLNGTPIDLILGNNKLERTIAIPEHAGEYTVQVTNKLALDLILYSRRINIVVVENNDCRFRDSLELLRLHGLMEGNSWFNQWDFQLPLDSLWGVILNADGCVECLDFDGEPDCLGASSTRNNNMRGPIPDLQFPNLRFLSFAGEFQLGDTIPNFTGLPLLEEFYCYACGLEGGIPNFSQTPLLNRINLDENFLDGSIPDFNALPNLEVLVAEGNSLEGPLPTLSNCPNLLYVALGDNQITGSVPEEYASLNLNTLSLEWNFIDYLPDLSGNLNWERSDPFGGLQVDSNQLTFDDLLPNMEIVGRGIFNYIPQDSIYTDTIISIKEGLVLRIDLGIDQEVQSSTYQWYCNDSLIAETSSNMLIVPRVSRDYSGQYQVVVTNRNVPGLSLYSRHFQVEVKENTNCRYLDSLQLVELYHALKGENWTTKWDLEQTMDSWYGVSLDENGCVYCIDFDGEPDCKGFTAGAENNLDGSIPDIQLSQLEFLSFAGNRNVKGPIPDFSGFPMLSTFFGYSCGLTGSIPDFSSVPNLRNINIYDNQLSGEVPNFTNLKLLNNFIASKNQLEAPIPSFDSCQFIVLLDLALNQIPGAIPDYPHLTRISTLSLESNRLDHLPDLSYIETWGSPLNFEGLQVENNRLTFEDILPNMPILEFGAFRYAPQDSIFKDTTYIIDSGGSLSVNLDIDNDIDNNFYIWRKDGVIIQESNSNLYNKSQVDLSDAGSYQVEVSNPGAPELTLYSKVFKVEVNEVNRCRTIDSTALMTIYDHLKGDSWKTNTGWGSNARLSNWHGISADHDGCVTRINLVDNGLDGSLPDSLAGLAELNQLFLNKNGISGQFPNWILSRIQLEVIDISENELSGTLLDQWSNLNQLFFLGLSNNRFTGNIPSSLGTLSQLKSLFLNSNGFTGSIPAQLGNLSNLQIINIGEGIDGPGDKSELSGPIPASFVNLKQLQRLIITYSGISEVVPPWIGELNELEYLWLLDNELEGTIPESIGNLPNLAYFDVSGNFSLGGSIPASFSQLRLKQFFISENEFTFVPPLQLEDMYEFKVSENGLTFESIVDQLDGLGPNAMLLYANQDSIYQDTLIQIQEGKPWSIDLEIDHEVPDNEYYWYRDGIEIGNVLDSNRLFFQAAERGHEGTYWVRVENDRAPALQLHSRRIQVEYIPDCSTLFLDLGADTLICSSNSTVELTPLVENCDDCTYQWSTGSTTPTLLVNPGSETIYRLELNDLDGCTLSDEITVRFPAPISFTVETTSANCGQSDGTARIEFPDQDNDYHIQWSTGDMDESLINNLDSGTYSVIINNTQGCLSEETFEIPLNKPEAVYFQDSVCRGDGYFIGGAFYFEPGTYEIQLQTGGGCDSLVLFDLSWFAGTTQRIDTSLCLGDTIWLFEKAYTKAGEDIIGFPFAQPQRCDSLVVSIYITENGEALPKDLIEGKDQEVCEPSLELSALLPPRTQGFWSTTSNAEIESFTEPVTNVKNLDKGSNLFIWTVFNLACESFQNDSIWIGYNKADTLAAESLTYELPANEKSIRGDLWIDNELNTDQEWQFKLIEIIGDLDLILSPNGRFSLEIGPTFDQGGFYYALEKVSGSLCGVVVDTGWVEVTKLPERPLPEFISINLSNNDILEIPNIDSYEKVEVNILGFWNNIVYSNSKYNNDWTGIDSQNQKKLPTGDYTYRIVVTYLNGDQEDFYGKILITF